MIKKNIEKIIGFFDKNIKKVNTYISKAKNQIRIIWSDPFEKYIFIFILTFIFSVVVFFVLRNSKNKVRFTIQGRVSRVKDGDTFVVGGKVVNLYGIDAPEFKQQCEYYNINTKKNSLYSCGESAKEYLKRKINLKNIKCDVKDEDKYGRFISICYIQKYDKKTKKYIEDLDVNRDLILNGYAVAYTKYSKKYVKEEYDAKKKKKGIWNGDFIRPEKYRKQISKK